MLTALAGVIALGAVAGILIDRFSGGEDSSAAVVPPPVQRRLIPWQALKTVDAKAVRACDAFDLAGVWQGSDAATGGQTINAVVLANRTERPCRVQGAPGVSLLAADGTGVRTVQTKGNTFPDGGNVAVILDPKTPLAASQEAQPGQAMLGFQWFRCNESRDIRNVLLSFRGGVVSVPVPRLAHVIENASGRPACRGTVPSLAVNNLAGTPPSWPNLVASIAVHGSAVPGGEFRYQVALRNNAPEAVRLHPCPKLEQSIGEVGGGAPAGFQLLIDCDAIGVLGPEEEVLIEMVLPVPKSFRAGEANVVWRMIGGPDTLTLITIEPGA